MAKQLNVNLAFTADTSKARQQLQDLQKQLTNLINKPTAMSSFGVTKEIEQASVAAASLKSQLEAATNVNTGKLDLGKFNQSLKQSNYQIKDYRDALLSLGPEGAKAFSTLAQSITTAEVPLRRSSALLTKFATTLKNTARWQLSSSILHGFMGSLQHAYGYAQDLNESLNNIRIVTGNSTEQMAQFAQEANKAAQSLSTTTTEYTNASLIYYQQGLSDEEVKERTDVTIKMANVARESAETVSDQMTAVWNNFYDGSKSLEYYADVMTALGAATASSTAEISEGLNKFAAVADTVGLSYEYATAALTTVTATTRQSADIVGNAFKTLFARIQGLNLGETLEDGTDLNKYSEALAAVGINIKDQAGEVKDMNTILDEMGAKWKTLAKDQQIALAQTVAGVRQYTQLVALMDNWDFFQQNLDTTSGAEGALQKQADIYAESWEAARDRVTAAAEEIYSQLLNDDFFIDLNNGFAKALNGVSDFIKGIGGLRGVLLGLGTVVLTVFKDQIAGSLQNIQYSLMMVTGAGRKAIQDTRQQANDELKTMFVDEETPTGDMAGAAYATQAQAQEELLTNAKDMTAEQQKIAQMLMDQHNTLVQNVISQKKITEEAEKQANIEIRNAKSILGNSKGKEISDFSKLTKQAATFRTVMDNAFGNFNNDVKDLGSQAQQIQRQIKGVTAVIKDDNIALEMFGETGRDAFNEFKADVKQAGTDSTKLETALQKLYDAITNVDQEAENLRPDLQDFSGDTEEAEGVLDRVSDSAGEAGVELGNMIGATANTENSISTFEERLKQIPSSIDNFSNSLVDIAQKISAIAMLISSLKGLVDTWNNDDMSFGDKMIATFTTLGFILPVVTASLEALNLAKLADIAETAVLAIGDWALAAAEKGVISEKVADTIATIALETAMSPLLLVVLALVAAFASFVAIATTVVLVANAIYKAYNKDKIAAQELSDQVEVLTERYNELTTSVNEFKTAVSEYNDALKALEELDKGTEEYAQALEDANAKAKELIETYKLFGDYEYKDGLIKIDKDALDKALEGASKEATDTEAQLYGTKIISTQADLKSQTTNLSRDIGAKVTFTVDGGLLAPDQTFYRDFNNSELESVANVINEISEENGNVKLSAEELRKTIMDATDAYGLSDTVISNLTKVINDDTINGLYDLADSMTEAKEANKYYAEQILGLEVKDKYGKDLEKTASDEEGNINEELYNQLVAAATASATKANEANGKSMDKEIADIDVSDISSNAKLRKKYPQYANIKGAIDGDKNLALTYAKEFYDVDPTTATYKGGWNIGTVKDASGKVIVDKVSDDVMRHALARKAEIDKIKEKYTDSLGEDSDNFIDALDTMVAGATDFGEKYGVNFTGALLNALASEDITELDFSSLFANLSQEEVDALNELGNSDALLKALGLTEEQVQALGYKSGEAFYTAWNSALDEYDPSLWMNHMVESANAARGDIESLMTDIQSGDITSENISENEKYADLLTKLEDIKDIDGDLTSATEILNKTWLVGTQEYYEALEQVQDKLYEFNLNHLQEEANKASDAIQELFTYDEDGAVIDINADSEEFESAMEKLLNAEYAVDVAIHTEAEQEFDSISAAMEDIANQSAYIGDDFVVAADKVRELNNTFPGILEGMQIVGDGTVKLNQEVVQSAMGMAEAEVQADAQATVDKLHNQATLLRAKQNSYQNMANAALILANSETHTAEESAAARAAISAELANLQELNSQEAAQSSDNNAKETADASQENGQVVAQNWKSAFQTMADASYQAASIAINNMNAVESGSEENLDNSKVSVQYKGSSGVDKETSIIQQTQDALKGEGEDTTDWAAMAEAYAQMADQAGAAANDIEGMIAQIGATATDVDKQLGGVSKGLGSDGEQDSSKSGGKEKSKETKDRKKADDELDRYWDINNAIKATSNRFEELSDEMKKTQTVADHLFGKALIANLKQQNEQLERENALVVQQRSNYQALYAEQRRELSELESKLSGFGAQFNGDALANYSSLLSGALAAYNAAIDAYNASAQEDADKLALEAAEKQYTEIKETIDRYRTLYYTDMADTQDKLRDLEQQELENRLKILENNLKSWEVEIELKLNITEAKRKWDEFLKEVKQDFRKIYEDLTINSKFDRSDFFTYVDDVGTTLGAIRNVEAEMNKLKNGGSSDMFYDITEAQEKLKELQEQLIENGKSLSELYKQIWENYISGLDQVKNKLEDINDQYKRIDDELEYEKELIELLYGDKAYALMDKYYKAQSKNILAQIDSMRTQVNFWQSEFNKAYQMNKDKHNVDLNDMSTWTEDMQKAYENMQDAQANLNDLILEGVKILHEEYLNAINEVIDTMDKNIWGMSLDDLKDNWDHIQKIADEYLDDIEGAYKIQTLANKIDQSIANTSSLQAQQKLQKLREEEIAMLREKENLTQDDIDLAEARYQIALKEIALEEAQQNKTSMKLTRDTSGNWTYQYVADEEDIMTKQQELLDAYNNLYQTADEAYAHAMELATDAYETMQEKIREIAEDMTLSEEEKMQRIQEIYDTYLPEIEAAVGNSELYRQEAMMATSAVFAEVCEQDEEAYNTLTDAQKEMVDAVRDNHLEDYEEIRAAIVDGVYPELNDAAKTTFEETNMNSKTAAADIITDWAKNNGSSVRSMVNAAINDMQKHIQNYEKELDNLQKIAGANFDKLGQMINKTSDKTDNLNDKTKKLCDDSAGYLSTLRSYVDEVAKAWDRVIAQIQTAKAELGDYLSLQFGGSSSGGSSGGSGNTGSGGSGSGNTGSGGSGSGSSGSGDGKLSVGDTATFTGQYYYDSYGLSPIGSKYSGVANGVVIDNVNNNPYGIHIHSADGKYGDLGWVEKSQLSGYDTGGYTGTWDNTGRLAFLHQKELVLNADDTSNILKAVSAIRDLTSLNGSISSAIATSIGSMAMNLVANGGGNINTNSNSNAENQFYITAEFPNANDVETIREAILSLPNLASQYIHKNK